jgi:UDP-glucose 4-epimerase
MLPEPKSPYALAKLAGEYYLKVYAECYGLETVALRYFNVFGPRQDPSSMYSGVISIFAERIAKGLPITIYGDGQQTRDFVNVRDVVQANLLAMNVKIVQDVEIVKRKSELNELCNGVSTASTFNEGSARFNEPQSGVSTFNEGSARFNAFNVATGKQISLLQLLDTLESITGNKVPRSFAPARPGDIRHSVASSGKLQACGWKPEVGLKDGLQELCKDEGCFRKRAGVNFQP